jgi:hypothetical protein
MMKPVPPFLLVFALLCAGQPLTPVVRAQDTALPAPAPPALPGETTPRPEAAAPAAKGVIPTPFPRERYDALLEKSPFAIASAPPEQVIPTENFATNWVISGISKQKSPEGLNRYTVFVRSRDLSKRLVISDDRPDDGVSLVSVEENPVAAKSTAILRKDSETGRVEFDQAVVAAAAPVPPVPGQPGKPGVPPVKNASKAGPIPRPGMQGSVPRPGVSQIPSPSGVPAPGASTQQEPRRRVRPIQEPP